MDRSLEGDVGVICRAEIPEVRLSSGVNHRFWSVVAALAVTVLWSSSWVIISVGLRDDRLQPVTFAGLRYGFAAVVLWAVVAGRRSARGQLLRLTKPGMGSLVLLGVVFYAVTQGAQFVAIGGQPVATTSLILTLTPLLVGLASGRLLGEGTGRAQLLAMLVVPAGGVAYFTGSLGATPGGLAACVVALAANAASSMMGRSVNRGSRAGPLVTTTVSMTAGALVLISVGVAVGGWPALSLRAVAIIAWLAVVNTALAFTLWNCSLRHLTASQSSVINNAMLVQIGLLGWAFLGQEPGPWQWAGLIIVSAGVAVGQYRPGRGRRAEIILATANPVKAGWMSGALESVGCPVRAARPEEYAGSAENGSDCRDNALEKLRAATARGIVISEDSGLFVSALGGQPGSRTDRWHPGTDDDRADQLLKLLTHADDRSALFISVVALRLPDGTEHVMTGELAGHIRRHRLEGHPGYASIFVADRQPLPPMTPASQQPTAARRSRPQSASSAATLARLTAGNSTGLQTKRLAIASRRAIHEAHQTRSSGTRYARRRRPQAGRSVPRITGHYARLMSGAAVACRLRNGSAAGWAEYEKVCPDRREADDDYKAAGRGGYGRCQAEAAPGGDAVVAELDACGCEHPLDECVVWEVLFAGQGPAEGQAVGQHAPLGGRSGPRVGGEQRGEVCP
jgi:non-canonical purine NTP pyrophosphatase (RdgB/HAM1 family)